MRNGKIDQTVRVVVNIRPRFDRFDTNRCIAVFLELIEQKLFTEIVNFITDRVLEISKKTFPYYYRQAASSYILRRTNPIHRETRAE